MGSMVYVRREVWELYLVEVSIVPYSKERFGHLWKTFHGNLIFLVMVSTWWFSCKNVLCLGLNQMHSFHVLRRLFTTCKILGTRIFSNKLPNVSKMLMYR